MTRATAWRWAPAAVLLIGATFTVGIDTQHPMQLRAPLDEAVPATMVGFPSQDVVLSDDEIRVAGVTSYLMRDFRPALDAAATDSLTESFSVYVGYYDSQTQGKTIHSPKNCLPGSGWEALQSRRVLLQTPDGAIPANRYLLQRGDQKALVVYWYQGRGRVEASEYAVKAQLLRDAALRGRTEEALVRIVVPITSDEEDAFRIAAAAAVELFPSVRRALPA